MNTQSRGTIRLRSKDPTEPPAIDPNFLTHPYDRLVHIDGIRHAMRLLSTPTFTNRTVELLGPENDSDEAIWRYIENNLHSTWHPSCTARMGYSKGNACVDKDFRVFGVEHLRIVDMSVCAYVPKSVLLLDTSYDRTLILVIVHIRNRQHTFWVKWELRS